ncbi:PIN domain-containing protein [Halapricum sp. CBA1109]|uniref:PIN domain-containing protein n=1 Tax=Halapricum sp. CBA1109 TaxID=2668068 RepID=UPI0013B9E0FB|nr:PIN domain-containing protein [Halapricum sp. CBA1109]
MTEQVVFDTEPLVAYADDEPGSDVVAAYLDDVVTGETDGRLTLVNATEIRYILARKYDRETADTFLDWLWTIGVDAMGIDSIWDGAAEYVIDHNPALGDSYALAAAATLDATLLVGGDQEYSDIGDVTVERFRDHGV